MGLSEARLDILRGVSLACRFFGLVFGREPTEDLLRAMKEQRLLEKWPLGDADVRAREGAELIRAFLVQYGDRPYELARRDYTDLFIGPERPLKQWESIWNTQDKLLFGDLAGEVGAFYARSGFVVQNQEPSDHIALEWSFLAELVDRIVRSGKERNTGELAHWLFETREFHDKHLGRWATCFLEELERRATTDYYRGTALLCRSTLDTIHNELGGM
ncbi:MAG: molecular chaperone [Solidesulfovibrio sp.]